MHVSCTVEHLLLPMGWVGTLPVAQILDLRKAFSTVPFLRNPRSEVLKGVAMQTGERGESSGCHFLLGEVIEAVGKHYGADRYLSRRSS